MPGSFGHRILDSGMPYHLRALWREVNALSEALRKIVDLRYGWDRRSNGREVLNRDRAEFLGITLAEFDNRLKRAHRQLRG